jgi:hypothetical protein
MRVQYYFLRPMTVGLRSARTFSAFLVQALILLPKQRKNNDFYRIAEKSDPSWRFKPPAHSLCRFWQDRGDRAHLIKNGSRPNNIIAFTFTEKAAAELKERIVSRCREELGEVHGMAEMYVGTIHAFCLDLASALIWKRPDMPMISTGRCSARSVTIAKDRTRAGTWTPTPSTACPETCKGHRFKQGVFGAFDSRDLYYYCAGERRDA